MQRDQATLLDIARSVRAVLEFTNGMDFAGFQDDRKTQSAVLHQLMVLGEAVKRLSSDVREDDKDIPWALIAGMRDKLIHAYDEVDLQEVWRTVEHDIPVLRKRIELLLPNKDS